MSRGIFMAETPRATAQDDCLAMLRRMGHDVAVVRSQDDAVLMLQEWGWPVR
jgi:hypothetical protein